MFFKKIAHKIDSVPRRHKIRHSAQQATYYNYLKQATNKTN